MRELPDEPLKSSPADDAIEQATQDENAAGDGAGTSAPTAQHNDRTQQSTLTSLRCTARTTSGRGRLRDLNDHASWQAVYSACAVRRWRP